MQIKDRSAISEDELKQLESKIVNVDYKTLDTEKPGKIYSTVETPDDPSLKRKVSKKDMKDNPNMFKFDLEKTTTTQCKPSSCVCNQES